MSENFKYKPDLMEWRRNTVMQRLAQGATQSQIAQELQLHPSTISLDVRQILWATNQILNKETLDNKTKIQCLTLLSNVYRKIADMTADGAIVEQAIKKVKQIQSRQQSGSSVETKAEADTEPETESETGITTEEEQEEETEEEEEEDDQ